jgi:hypothetical protein
MVVLCKIVFCNRVIFEWKVDITMARKDIIHTDIVKGFFEPSDSLPRVAVVRPAEGHVETSVKTVQCKESASF